MEQTIAMLALLQQAESYDCEIAALTAKLAEVTALKKAAIADAKALRKAAAAEQAAERLRERHEARAMAGEDKPARTERIEVSKIANMLEEMYVKLGIKVGTAKSRRETIKEAKRIFNEFQKTTLRQERTAMRSIETVEPARSHDLRRERFAMSSIVVEHTERTRTASEELAEPGSSGMGEVEQDPEAEPEAEPGSSGMGEVAHEFAGELNYLYARDRSKPDPWRHEIFRSGVWSACDLTTSEFNEMIESTKWHDLHWQAMLRYCWISKAEFGSLNPRARGQLIGWLKSLDGYPQANLAKGDREVDDFSVLRKVLKAVKALPEASEQDQVGQAQA